MHVKVCGITTLATAKAVEEAGTDFIGFVFAPSKRRIALEDAAVIGKELSTNIKKVGVFVNTSIETINQVAQIVNLDMIQLHGDEPADFADQLPYPIIKAFSINQATPEEIASYPCEYVLIDSPGDDYRGGSGKTFSWELLDELHIPREKLILAGGLTPHNIQKAIQTVRPSGVDVSSGVETNGNKDIKKINSFITNAKETERLK